MLLACGCHPWTAHVPTPPRASITPPSQNLAGSSQGPKLTTTYTVRNDGESDLVIKEVKATCGCTLTSVPSRVIKSGESGQILVEATPPVTGENRVAITVISNAIPDQQVVYLNLQGVHPVQFVALTSGSVRFGRVTAPGRSVEFFIETRERADTQPWIVASQSESPDVVIKGALAKSTSIGDGVEIRRYSYMATISKRLPTGTLRSNVKLFSRDSGAVPAAILPLEAHFGTSTYVLPRSIYISKDAGEAIQPTFIVVKTEAESLPLKTSVRDKPGVYRFHLVESSPDLNKYQVTFDPGVSNLNDEIVVETNDERSPTLTIPVVVKSSSPQ